MIDGARTSRRGVALLLVLAVLVIAASANVAIARAASICRARVRIDVATRIADDLLRAADAPIRHWLEMDSAATVLPPVDRAPAVPVLHDRWTAGGREIELRIAAWDQCGMVPWGAIRRASPLHLVVPSEIRQAIRDRSRPDREPAGLDQAASADERSDRPAAFPTSSTSGLVIFGREQSRTDLDHAAAAAAPAEVLAVGSIIATHVEAPGRVNVNTAPIALLEQAMRLAGRGSLESIIEARHGGRAAPIDSIIRDPDAIGHAPVLVASSDAWAVRIDIRVGPVRRAWWVVYIATRHNQWECVQRLAIDT